MNMLLDALPQEVKIKGQKFSINSDFRTSVLFELLMQDDSVPKNEKFGLALQLYYPKIPPIKLMAEAVNALLWFYKGGKEDDSKKGVKHVKMSDGNDQEEDELEAQPVKRIYSFEYDDKYIYSAFLSQYGIDLADIDYLHWWKFKALFNSLDDKCQFCKIMGYRSVKINNKMTKEQKAFYRRMKSMYALPISETEQERQDAITQALLNGGDLTGLL